MNRLLVFVLSPLLALAAMKYQSHGIDDIRSSLLALFFRDDSAYAAGYTDKGFGALRSGMARAAVLQWIGVPLRCVWVYGETQHNPEYVSVSAEGRIVRINVPGLRQRGDVRVGMSAADFLRTRGKPESEVYSYSVPQHDGSYRIRQVEFHNDRVEGIKTGFYVD